MSTVRPRGPPGQFAAPSSRVGGLSSPSSAGSETSNRRIPVTPGVLRSIFASSRTVMEERSISRVAFFRFAGFILSCVMMSVAAARNRGRPAVGILAML
ncbi:hypothetical protein PIIN_11855 [Serendipita indica DSM 11827]|uniref:Uncharacterized protein n=1 Tax=Serendipita indica (strain DSM 11827) TaxID=1109443 RepID=G4TH89_SERID|nr:hypothetical protein PIIN_11855 [Serendipita indica DSM 11827]